MSELSAAMHNVKGKTKDAIGVSAVRLEVNSLRPVPGPSHGAHFRDISCNDLNEIR